jgi:hypothetical protein
MRGVIPPLTSTAPVHLYGVVLTLISSSVVRATNPANCVNDSQFQN